MSKEPTEKELELAARVNELDDASMRPAVAGGGLLSAAVNFLMGHVTRGIMAVGLIIFIAYHGWIGVNSVLQLRADL